MESNPLESVVVSLQRIQYLLHESPEVLQFLTLLKETGADQLVSPVRADKLIEAGQAAEVLKVSRNRIGAYCRAGLLPAYYTPGSNNRKFWLRDVLALAQKEVNP